jgi:hypothetical protein
MKRPEKDITALMKMKEKELQKVVHCYFISSHSLLFTESGKCVQVLSPGEINLYEGPDFKNAAIIIDGNFVTGDMEFHKKSSHWNQHSHKGSDYQKVLLHIVLINNTPPVCNGIDTLVINAEHLLSIIREEIAEYDLKKCDKDYSGNEIKVDSASLLDLQDWALSRIMRKSSEAAGLLQSHSPQDTLSILIKRFFESYFSKRRRKRYNWESAEEITQGIIETSFSGFWDEICKNGVNITLQELNVYLKRKVSCEGEGIRREIFVNCVLPLLIALTEGYSRLHLLSIFWSMSSAQHYGAIGRKYPKIPQNYVWEQQGILEYIRNTFV